ncbi:MHS family MFS transporter [Paraburkholderia panacisoli]|uniref:MHS family MFS transporter n=1 Tax=Paraburkholderia panacisoli TaxID=2603818 RepID=A0A5B0GKT7_9BURK|nr:MHS family MFS transporter [Paraburkholderia panacisoli]
MDVGIYSGAAVAGSLGKARALVECTLGTLFEWYDLFLYGTLASVISARFFSGLSSRSHFIFALLAFGIGFAFRPLGALIFGRLGDRLGRKLTFLATFVMVGGSTRKKTEAGDWVPCDATGPIAS